MTRTASQRPRIAVIAVHGVADQKPSDTVRTAAKMLARAAEWAQPSPESDAAMPAANPSDKLAKLANLAPPGTYSAFEEHGLRIPVVRVPTPGRGASSA